MKSEFDVIYTDKDLRSANRTQSMSNMTPTRRAASERQVSRPIPEKPDAGSPLNASTHSVHARPTSSVLTFVPQKPARELQSAPDAVRLNTGRFYVAMKRLYDVVLGTLLLLVATPIILIAATAIRLETPGAPFFIQTRVGKNGRPFKIVKLRGMFIDSRIRFASYYDYTNKDNLDFCFHLEADPRVTRAGKFLRRTSIDELPNLWNVVVGDMSLVGPRPEIPEVMALYGSYRDEYLSVKPGVTCMSKCTGRDRLTKRETIEYDLDYIRRRNFKLDMQMLWRTFRGVVLRRDVF